VVEQDDLGHGCSSYGPRVRDNPSEGVGHRSAPQRRADGQPTRQVERADCPWRQSRTLEICRASAQMTNTRIAITTIDQSG
jgi:hypothetical protein